FYGIGGLVGIVDPGSTVSNSYATGAVVEGSSVDVGGLVGVNGGAISNSYAMGAVGGGNEVGGLVGINIGTISDAYAVGAVSANFNAGGLVGYNQAGIVTDGYWDTETSGQSTSAGGIGMTTAQLQGTLPGGFGNTVWGTGAGLYPYFLWQYPTTPEAISGKAYSDAGVTVLASNASDAVVVSALVDGANVGTATTGANGYYYILVPGNTLTGSQQLVTYLDGASVAANTYVAAPSGNVSDADLYGGYLRLISDAGTTSSMFGGLATGLGGSAGGNFLYSGGSLATGTSLDIESSNASGLSLDSIPDLAGATLILNATGAVTQSAPIVAGDLELLGANASYNLTGNANSIGTLAADTGAVSLADNAALTIDTVNGSTGVTSAGAVTLTTPGNLTIAAGAAVSAGSNDDVVLSAGGDFLNDAGSNAVATAGTGRWLIYSDAPGTDVFDALDSNNMAVWGMTYVTLPPSSVLQAGDIYIFAFQPTLTITTTNVAKTYGNDATAEVAGAYAISGLEPGVEGAFLGDTAADVYAGTPLVTSAGSPVTARVAGSPYAITATTGTLSLRNNYVLNIVDSGALTVDARPITVTANDLSQTYGGSTPALTYAVGGDGLVNGDTLSGALATSANAASNVGTYAITEGTLAASSNYALTYVPGTLSVGPAPLSIAANDVSAASIATAKFSASYQGFVNGQTSAIVTGLQYGTAPVPGDALEFTITPFGATAPNYAISYTQGLLTIALPPPSTLFAPLLGQGGYSIATLINLFGSNKLTDVATGALGDAFELELLFQNGIPGTVSPFDALEIGDYSNAFSDSDRLVVAP
ncbi:MAG TPA: MBG domain-containing protein, partial [Xanthobacteraceae bacterium]|nr:MBG domain-containing protein [Xanthobacteraceae bacterium]